MWFYSFFSQLIMKILSALYLCLSYNYQKYVLKKKWHIQSSPEVPQNFSLPENIVYYLQRNATNHLVLTNLQKSCKHFGSHYKIVELRDLLCLKEGVSLNPKTAVIVNNRKKEITDEQLLSWPVHYAFTGMFGVRRPSMPLLTSKLISKAFISNVCAIQLIDQILTFKEFKFLAVNASWIFLLDCQVFDEDKEVVPAPRLIPWDSDFECFNFSSQDESYFPHEAFQEMTSKTIDNLSKKEVSLVFRPLPSDFDPTVFIEFLMNNQSENLTVSLSFDPMNDQIARNVQEFIYETLEDVPKEKKPRIEIRVFS